MIVDRYLLPSSKNVKKDSEQDTASSNAEGAAPAAPSRRAGGGA